MSSNVFITDDIRLDIGFAAARCRLERLGADGVLLGAAEYAYSAGTAGLVDAAGLMAGMSRLAGVRSGDLVETGGCARLCLRWDAIGPDGALFPALDADLTLSPAGEDATVLALAGIYRLPLQAAGLDEGTVRHFATVTIGSFTARLGCALSHPAGATT